MHEDGLGVDGSARFYHPDGQLIQSQGNAEVQGRVAVRSLKHEVASLPELLQHPVALEDGVEFLLSLSGEHDFQGPGVVQEAEGKSQQLFICRLDFLFFRFRELDRPFLRIRQGGGCDGCCGQKQHGPCHLSHGILIGEGKWPVTSNKGHYPSLERLTWTASTVRSMSSSVWAVEMKPVSYGEGAK